MADQQQEDISIWNHLQASHEPAVFDFSGQYPFEIYFEVKRTSKRDREVDRSLTLQTTSSALDSTYAFTHGLLEIFDLENDTKLDFHSLDNPPQTSRLAKPTEDDFITLPSRDIVPGAMFVNRLADYILPLNIAANIKQYLTAGREYRLQISDGNRDLGIQWWRWGSKEGLNITEDIENESLGTSSPGRIMACRSSHVRFSVVESFPIPPPISISFSHEDFREGSEDAPKLSFDITTINNGSQAITVKSALGQRYIHPVDFTSTIPSHARVTSLHRRPSLWNFSIVDESDNELCPYYVSPSYCPSSHKNPENYTNLEPGISVTVEATLPDHTVKKIMGHKCRLRIRPLGAWWRFGTIDKVLPSIESYSALDLLSKPPIMLTS